MPSPITRAMQQLTDVGDFQRATSTRRVGADRDVTSETAANVRYEQLRTLDEHELRALAVECEPDLPARLGRQQLIGIIIDHESRES